MRSTSGDPLAFLPGVAEKLGYYYALRDPRAEAILNVGKGRGDRVYQHALREESSSSPTRAALEVEADVIDGLVRGSSAARAEGF